MKNPPLVSCDMEYTMTELCEIISKPSFYFIDYDASYLLISKEGDYDIRKFRIDFFSWTLTCVDVSDSDYISIGYYQGCFIFYILPF